MACFSVCVPFDLALFLWIAFGCVLILFLCVFLLILLFVLPCPLSYIRSYRFPGMFRIRSGAWHATSAAALRCRSLPSPIDYWFDIGPIAVWKGNGPSRRNRMNEPEELPISDGPGNVVPFLDS